MWGLMIICYLFMALSFVLVSITGLQSYFEFNIFSANYQQFALFSTIFYMFSQTLIMFYFIGSGTAIKKEVSILDSKTDAYEKVKKSKMILFPHLTLNMFFMGTAFILIGAVDTGSVSSLIQSIIFLCAYFHFIYSIRIQHIGFKDNINLVIELAKINQVKSVIN